MTKLDLIKLIIETDDNIIEELKYNEFDKVFLGRLLLLGNKIEYIGNIDKIGYIEIDNDQIYVEPKIGYELTSFNSCDLNSNLDKTTCLNYHWKIKKVD